MCTPQDKFYAMRHFPYANDTPNHSICGARDVFIFRICWHMLSNFSHFQISNFMANEFTLLRFYCLHSGQFSSRKCNLYEIKSRDKLTSYTLMLDCLSLCHFKRKGWLNRKIKWQELWKMIFIKWKLEPHQTFVYAFFFSGEYAYVSEKRWKKSKMLMFQ